MLGILKDSDLLNQFEYNDHEASILRKLGGDRRRIRFYKVLKILNIYALEP